MTGQKTPSEERSFDEFRANVKGVKDDVKEAIADDQPLDKHAPGAAFGLVMWTYLGAMILLLLGMWLIYALVV